MIAITVCFPAQNCLRQERFPPEGHQTLRIEIFRMQRPEPHLLLAPNLRLEAGWLMTTSDQGGPAGYCVQETPAGAPVGAPIRTAGDASF